MNVVFITAGPDCSHKKQSDQGLYCLPFYNNFLYIAI